MSGSLPPSARGGSGSGSRGAGLGGDALLPASTSPSLQAQYSSLRSIYGSSPRASRPAHTYTPAAPMSRRPVLTMTAPLPSVHRAPATKQPPPPPPRPSQLPSAPLTRTWSPSSSASTPSHERLKRPGQEFESARLVTISFDGSLRQGSTTRGRGGDSASRVITSSRRASLGMSIRERREMERLREIHAGQEEKLRRAKEWLVQRQASSSCFSSFSSVSASSSSPALPALATATRDEPAGPAAGDAPATGPLEGGTGTELLSETKEGGTQTEQPPKTDAQSQATQTVNVLLAPASPALLVDRAELAPAVVMEEEVTVAPLLMTQTAAPKPSDASIAGRAAVEEAEARDVLVTAAAAEMHVSAAVEMEEQEGEAGDVAGAAAATAGAAAVAAADVTIGGDAEQSDSGELTAAGEGAMALHAELRTHETYAEAQVEGTSGRLVEKERHAEVAVAPEEAVPAADERADSLAVESEDGRVDVAASGAADGVLQQVATGEQEQQQSAEQPASGPAEEGEQQGQQQAPIEEPAPGPVEEETQEAVEQITAAAVSLPPEEEVAQETMEEVATAAVSSSESEVLVAGPEAATNDVAMAAAATEGQHEDQQEPAVAIEERADPQEEPQLHELEQGPDGCNDEGRVEVQLGPAATGADEKAPETEMEEVGTEPDPAGPMQVAAGAAQLIEEEDSAAPVGADLDAGLAKEEQEATLEQGAESTEAAEEAPQVSLEERLAARSHARQLLTEVEDAVFTELLQSSPVAVAGITEEEHPEAREEEAAAEAEAAVQDEQVEKEKGSMDAPTAEAALEPAAEAADEVVAELLAGIVAQVEEAAAGKQQLED